MFYYSFKLKKINIIHHNVVNNSKVKGTVFIVMFNI